MLSLTIENGIKMPSVVDERKGLPLGSAFISKDLFTAIQSLYNKLVNEQSSSLLSSHNVADTNSNSTSNTSKHRYPEPKSKSSDKSTNFHWTDWLMVINKEKIIYAKAMYNGHPSVDPLYKNLFPNLKIALNYLRVREQIYLEKKDILSPYKEIIDKWSQKYNSTLTEKEDVFASEYILSLLFPVIGPFVPCKKVLIEIEELGTASIASYSKSFTPFKTGLANESVDHKDINTNNGGDTFLEDENPLFKSSKLLTHLSYQGIIAVIKSVLLNCPILKNMKFDFFLNPHLRLKCRIKEVDGPLDIDNLSHFVVTKETTISYMSAYSNINNCDNLTMNLDELIPSHRFLWKSLERSQDSLGSGKHVLIEGPSFTDQYKFDMILSFCRKCMYPLVFFNPVFGNHNEFLDLKKEFQESLSSLTVELAALLAHQKQIFFVIRNLQAFSSIKSDNHSEKIDDNRYMSQLSYILVSYLRNLNTNIFIIGITDSAEYMPVDIKGEFSTLINLPAINIFDRAFVIKHRLKDCSEDILLKSDKLAEKTHGFSLNQLELFCRNFNWLLFLRTPNKSRSFYLDDRFLNSIFLEAFHLASYSSQSSTVGFTTGVSLMSTDDSDVSAGDIPTWEDIGGYDDVKKMLQQTIEWPLKYADTYSRLGLKPPHGILLFGPPGCSKTSLVRIVSQSVGYHFLSLSSADLYSCYVGESERLLRNIFRFAREKAPALIFLDELDALVGSRSIGDTGDGDNGSSSSGSAGPSNKDTVQERILSVLLNELDGIEPLSSGIVIIGATNRMDKIDRALLRPGRFDKLINIPLPTSISEILSIFSICSRRLPLLLSLRTNTEFWKEMAHQCLGYSGAFCKNVCQEAALIALRENGDAEFVKEKHFYLALRRCLCNDSAAQHTNITEL